MAKISIGVLIIFLIINQAQSQLEISLELIQQIYEWVTKIYETIDKYNNPDKTSENIETIMNQVAEVSSKLDNLENHLDINLDKILNLLLADIKVEAALQNSKSQLRYYLNKIDFYFDLSRDYNFGGSYGNQTVKDFAHKILWSGNSIPDILDEMHDLFIPGGLGDSGLISLIFERSMLNLLHDCNTYISAQQQIYYIYIHLIISEFKGLLTLQQSHMIERLFDESGYKYVSEINASKDQLDNRVKEYYELFSKEIGRFPQQIRRCEVKSPQRDVNFIELQKFSRIKILDAKIVIADACVACPRVSALDEVSISTNTTVNNCRNMGTTLTTCPAKSGSPHEYLWWRDENGNYYGPNTPCANEKKILGGFVRNPVYPTYYFSCVICACIVHTNNYQENDNSSIWRISVTEQISDLWNNKVVTGIRFVTQDNALHIQIQQAEFNYSGMVYNNTEWKSLDVNYYNGNIVKKPMLYETLRHDRKTIYLDDISVSDGFVVTGVRFKLTGDFAFQLQIFQSQYKLGNGNVSPFGGSWVDASTHPMNQEDYKQERIEIDLDASDDPTRGSEFEYDLQSNRLIKFTHSDIHKDAGQTTIPLLDAQSAVTQPAFPLGGIGLTFMGRKHFGGYIIPRVFTLNMNNHLEYPIVRANIPIATARITRSNVRGCWVENNTQIGEKNNNAAIGPIYLSKIKANSSTNEIAEQTNIN